MPTNLQKMATSISIFVFRSLMMGKRVVSVEPFQAPLPGCWKSIVPTLLQEEGAMLRRALAESMKQLRLATSDVGAMVDRRIVTQLLITYFERGRSDRDVLNLMARMLGFSGARPPACGLIWHSVCCAPIAVMACNLGFISLACSPACWTSSVHMRPA